MKRERGVDSITMANYLMLLSRGDEVQPTYSNTRVFECKTCNRQFPSFQALGGHRASHKKPRLIGGDHAELDGQLHPGLPAKPKTHECSVCGLEFAIGQALGGHMRRHRAAAAAALNESMQNNSITMSSSSSGSSLNSSVTANSEKKVNSKRVLLLDLNLTPLENDLEVLKIGKSAIPLVDCFY